MPSGIMFDQPLTPSEVTRPTSGFTLFSNASDGNKPYIMLPNGTSIALSGCGGSCSGGSCGVCTVAGSTSCADIAGCMSDPDVVSAITAIVNGILGTTPVPTLPTCPPGGPTGPGTIIGEYCVDVSVCPWKRYYRNGTEWITCSTCPDARLMEDGSDRITEGGDCRDVE